MVIMQLAWETNNVFTVEIAETTTLMELHMLTLKRSTDRKTANLSTPNGKQAKIKNAFGLPAGKEFSCPGMTSVCGKICYAGKLEKLFPGFRNVMEHNWNQVKDASYDELVEGIDSIIKDFIADCDKWDAEKLFRIHHDGDMFNVLYAKAWATVIKNNPDVKFWLYTRSYTKELNIVPFFAGLDNVSLYLSVDTDNANEAMKVKKDNPWVKLAGLGETFDKAAALVKVISGRNSVARCPELNGALPLITTDGGACSVCNLCVEGRGDVVFSTTKK